MPLFHHKNAEEPDDGSPGEGADAPEQPDQWRATLAYYAGLPFAQRAAELLGQITPTLQAGSANSAQTLLDPLIPPIHSIDLQLSEEEFAAAVRLEAVLHDALQTLVLGRLLMRIELSYRGATEITYRLSPDGSAAVAAGNAAEVLTRRVAD